MRWRRMCIRPKSRATGVGTAVAVGRIGNVLASYVGAFALDAGGAAAFFSTWAASMAVVLCRWPSCGGTSRGLTT